MSESSFASRPAFGLTAEDSARDGSVYRYTVRCDRETFHRIEAAAKRAGKSGTGFVQAHFETIFGAAKSGPGEGFDAAAFAARHRLTLPAARVYGALVRLAGEDGSAVVRHEPLAEAAGIGLTYLSRCVDALEMRDLVERDGFRGVHGTAYIVRQVS